MNFKHWILPEQQNKDTALLQRVLIARGCTRDISQEMREPHDPMLMRDMDQAVRRIRQAVIQGERILVYGDYDCDGITATVMLYDYLENCGADVLYYIPDRETEGYGLSAAIVEKIGASGTKLIVTVDNGISSIEEVRRAKELGMDVVVTDHHKPGDLLPDAAAVLNPHRADCGYPFRELSGAAVAFKLICALDGDWELMMEQYGDLLALGVLADVVELTGENRFFAVRGLACLAQTQRMGLAALSEKAGLTLSPDQAESVIYGLVPRINVTGRLGSADDAVELLLSEDPDRAAELAEKLDRLNARRKEIEKEILKDCCVRISRDPALLHQRVLILCGEGWNPGVIGITAARLVSRYGKPCVMIALDGEEARGSARSLEGFDMIAAVRRCAGVLRRHGGHPMAAGFSLAVKDIPAFCAQLQQAAAAICPVMPVASLHIDAQAQPAEATLGAVRELGQLAPFGCGNPQPLLAFMGLTVDAMTPVGNGCHLRLDLSKEGERLQMICFGVGPHKFPFEVGDRVDCAAQLKLNTWNGQERVSVQLISIRPAGEDDRDRVAQTASFDALMRGEVPAGTFSFDREDLSVIFRFLRGHSPYAKGPDALAAKLGEKSSPFKVRAGIQILRELGLAQVTPDEEIVIPESSGKVTLDQSFTYNLLSHRKA